MYEVLSGGSGELPGRKKQLKGGRIYSGSWLESVLSIITTRQGTVVGGSVAAGRCMVCSLLCCSGKQLARPEVGLAKHPQSLCLQLCVHSWHCVSEIQQPPKTASSMVDQVVTQACEGYFPLKPQQIVCTVWLSW